MTVALCQYPQIAHLRSDQSKQKPENLHRAKSEEQCHPDPCPHYFYHPLRDNTRARRRSLTYPSIVGTGDNNAEKPRKRAVGSMAANEKCRQHNHTRAKRYLLFDDSPNLSGPGAVQTDPIGGA